MVKGTTASGFKFEVDQEILKDMEYIELAAETQSNSTKFPELVKMTLGEEQKKALYEHVRNENGRVLVDAVSDEFVEIIGILGEAEETKN